MTLDVRRRFVVGGIVQGVGFRPFAHRLASELDLGGFVRNEADHVLIEVEGSDRLIAEFRRRLRSELPPMARIDTVRASTAQRRHQRGFSILTSGSISRTAGPVLIPADRSVCDDCLSEMSDPTDRRYRHPFINCTNCGPRFTIINGLPYDRRRTTMARFDMCPACRKEYDDPGDRRFHAQPVACPDCGPTLRHERQGVVTATGDAAIAAVQIALSRGDVVAVKGIGGYHLVVDATSDSGVASLRRRKNRPHEPFAVMVGDVDVAATVGRLSPVESSSLTSPARPIVVLKRADRALLAAEVTGDATIGVMLAYSPLHHLLFRPVPGHASVAPVALVVTSANVSGEPICTDDSEARHRLGHLADSICSHDRPIGVPCDDSVVRVVGDSVQPLRRSRGYAPLPVGLPFDLGPSLGVGGDVKNAFCVASGRHAWMSQHIGDMENLETVRVFETSVELLGRLHSVRPQVVAVDPHPRYQTRRWARALGPGIEVVEVQHHHAHLAALMAEHGMRDDEPVAGMVFDGTGYGPDGTLWGGEVLVGGYARCERWGHLADIYSPGGDAAVLNPCRSALAHLAAAGIDWDDDIASVRACSETERGVMAQMVANRSGGVVTSSMGRLFDAVSSVLDVVHRSTFEAQAPMGLEALASGSPDAGPVMAFEVSAEGIIDPAPVLRAIVEGLRSGLPRPALARSFHEAVADVTVTTADLLRRQRSIETVGLTGGVFQNALLAVTSVERLTRRGFEVLTHTVVPANDGGLALGQVAVAAHRSASRSSVVAEQPTCA